ncbi:MAG: AAA family ATPase [Acidimicrobiales bacterium]
MTATAEVTPEDLGAHAARLERRAGVRTTNGNRPPGLTDGRSKPIVSIFTPPLVFHGIADLIDALAKEPPPTFLASPIWPGDAYGILGTPMKAGKTWLVSDLAVAVAHGGAWLGKFPIERRGPVLMFLGEGGKRKMVRRLEAVAEFYGVELRSLPIVLCLRAPHLSDEQHLTTIAAELGEVRPSLTVIDPLYLAARGAQGSQLYEMGAVLEGIQSLCQQVDSALLVSHHLNRQEGRGMGRLSGAGPAEWGRVIVTGEAKVSHTDPETQESAVTLELDFVGDEIPETTLTIRRHVRAVDPDDLASRLVYSVEILENVIRERDDGMPPSHQRVLEIVNNASGEWLDTLQIGDKLADQGRPLKRVTILAATKALVDNSLIERRGSVGNAFQWRQLSTDNHEGGKNDL